ncbi:hypothetical protein GCM10007216_05410 [Thalassobacillus devorans]|uniref:Uncharacterized protein n=1 Tax=Thalassobacillus devorans TaxID=279813 RepID=A0ABQ1NIP7_9BACI|nr:DUF5696 domain-containing protein [Thalassobacillus devorans]NIK27448.1 hypothetical protein [Thalassobacillus devorans]GGC77801.1 hypothetical protein GCM10007216_05410 [Thalassobacillus devorans]
MSSKWKWIVLVVVLLFPIQVIANSLIDDDPDTDITEEQEKRSNEMFRYKSNQYTQPENEEATVDNAVSLDGYEQVAVNDHLALYVEPESLALKIENKHTGYLWSSGLEEDKDYNLNNTWSQMAHSAITIDYIDDKDKSSTESILTNESEVSLTKQANGFSAKVSFEDAEITVQLDVHLDGDSIEVHVPQDGIEEDENKLATMRLYPFLGAVEGTDTDGYLFIPDGSGALMRFDEKQVQSMAPYRASIYGDDEGFKRSAKEEGDVQVNPAQKITMPVYGVTNGVDENGFINVIDEGKTFADIIAYPSGIATDFHWITAQYNYRYQYYQPTSKNMSGYNVYQEQRNEFDVNERITFLEDEAANYVGMAHTYQQYLLDREMLAAREDHADIRLEFLGGEVKSGLLRDSVQPMTKVTDLPDYVEQLKQQEVEDMHVVYRGWTEGGYTGTLPKKFPFENELGSDSEFSDVNDFFKDNEIPLYYYTDYTKAYHGASGFSGKTDIARKISAETMGGKDGETDFYYLSPLKSLEIAKDDRSEYEKNGVENLAVDSSANLLFSDFNNGATRPEVMEVYQDMFEELRTSVDSLSLYQPNDYLLTEADRYLDIPLYSSNYSFVTDTVPFLQIVLKGYVPYYASFSNFQYSPEDEVLRMIEYGAYPSFYLTTEPSHQLMHTPSEDLYTSQFQDWEEAIVEQYKMVKESLGPVEGETITSRNVYKTGVVEVGYSNGKSVIVNYTNEDINIEGTEVKAKGYTVTDRGNPS